MCFKKILKIFAKNKSKKCQVKLDEAVDLHINYDKSVTYFCDFIGKRHLVLNFDIQNKSESKLCLQLKLLPFGKMVKEIRWPMCKSCSGEIIYPNSAGQKYVKASYDESPFEIAANSCERNQIIIVKEFNINSKLQLVVISGNENMHFDIETNRIVDKIF